MACKVGQEFDKNRFNIGKKVAGFCFLFTALISAHARLK